MATRKSVKPPKKTPYPDLVLQAFTQVQKDTRKHSIHHLTLRALIKKKLVEDNRGIGPKTGLSITKAIRRLQEEGILEYAKNEPGSYVLTAPGKAGVRSARLSVGGPSSGIPLNEDLVLEHMGLPVTPRGKKRGRRSSLAPPQGNDESDAEYEPPPTLKFKRPRTSAYDSQLGAASPRRETRQRDQEADAAFRENSPLTDLGDNEAEDDYQFEEEGGAEEGAEEEDEHDEETLQLKAELAERDDEIDRLQRELDELRRTHVQHDSNRAATPQGPPSPEPTSDSTRVSRSVPNAATRSRPSLGVTLTHSGSLISNVSKQPTPAPSTPEESPPENPFDSIATNEDGFDTLQNESAVPGPNGDDSADKILELEDLLAVHLLEIQKLEGRLSDLQARQAELEQDVSDRDGRISALSDDVTILRQEAIDQAAKLDEKERELSAKGDVLSASETTNAKLETELSNRDSQIAMLNADITRLEQQASDQSAKLNEKESELSAKGAVLSALEKTNSKLEADLSKRDSQIATLNADIIRHMQDFTDLMVTLALKDDELVALNVEKDELFGTVSTQQADISNCMRDIACLRKEAAEGANALSARQSELSSLETKYTELNESSTTRIDKLDQTMRERDDTIAALEATKLKYMSELSTLQQALSNAESAVASHAERAASANKQAATLRAEMLEQQKASEAEIHAQRVIVQELEGEIKTLSVKQQELKREIEKVQTSKVEALARAASELSDVEEQVREAEASRDSLQGQLKAALDEKTKTAKALATSEASVSTLKAHTTSLEGSVARSSAEVEELTSSLNQAQQDVTAARVMGEIAVETLKLDLGTSRQTADGLRAEVKALKAERDDVAKRLEVSLLEASRVSASLEEAKTSLKSKEKELADLTVAAEQLRTELVTTTTKVDEAEERNASLTAKVAKKDAEIKEHKQTVSMTESMAAKFREEAETKEAAIEDLHTQLTDALSTAFSAKEELESTQNGFALKADQQQFLIEKLEKDFQATRRQSESQKAELVTLRSAKANIQAQLDVQGVFLMEERMAVDQERKLVQSLEAELNAVGAKLQEAEDEIAELNESKDTDAATITGLKAAFSTFKEMQMRSLAEADSTVASAKSSPMPNRRTGRNGIGKGNQAPPPFSLT